MPVSGEADKVKLPFSLSESGSSLGAIVKVSGYVLAGFNNRQTHIAQRV